LCKKRKVLNQKREKKEVINHLENNENENDELTRDVQAMKVMRLIYKTKRLYGGLNSVYNNNA